MTAQAEVPVKWKVSGIPLPTRETLRMATFPRKDSSAYKMALEFLQGLFSILVLQGPAGTGKTYPTLMWLHLTMLRYPGTKALVVRKVARTLAGTTLATFREKVAPEAIAAGLVSLPHLAAGAINFSGGKAVVGERGPEVVELPRGSNVIPSGGWLGGGTQVTVAPGAIVFQYPIMNDQQSRSAVAGLVIDELYAKLRREGLRVPAGSRG